MTLTVEESEKCTLIKIEGKFDTAVNQKTLAFFENILKGNNKNVVVDMSLTTQIDSSGIGALVYLFKRIHSAGYNLELTGLHGRALKKLELLGLNKVIKIR